MDGRNARARAVRPDRASGGDAVAADFDPGWSPDRKERRAAHHGDRGGFQRSDRHDGERQGRDRDRSKSDWSEPAGHGGAQREPRRGGLSRRDPGSRRRRIHAGRVVAEACRRHQRAIRVHAGPAAAGALGYGCASAGSGELAVLGLVALLALRRRRLGWMSLVLALGVSVAGTANAAGPGKTPAQAPAQPIDVARTLNRKGIEALSQARSEEATAMFEEGRKSGSSP